MVNREWLIEQRVIVTDVFPIISNKRDVKKRYIKEVKVKITSRQLSAKGCYSVLLLAS